MTNTIDKKQPFNSRDFLVGKESVVSYLEYTYRSIIAKRNLLQVGRKVASGSGIEGGLVAITTTVIAKESQYYCATMQMVFQKEVHEISM